MAHAKPPQMQQAAMDAVGVNTLVWREDGLHGYNIPHLGELFTVTITFCS